MSTHTCSICSTGTYHTHVEYDPETGPPDQLNNFGIVRPVAMSKWTIQVCDACGNVQLFRPDLVAQRS